MTLRLAESSHYRTQSGTVVTASRCFGKLFDALAFSVGSGLRFTRENAVTRENAFTLSQVIGLKFKLGHYLSVIHPGSTVIPWPHGHPTLTSRGPGKGHDD